MENNPSANNPSEKRVYFPLGGSMFGYIQTRGGQKKIHVRHFEYSETKGKAIKSRRGVSMTLEQFKKLVKMKKHISKDFQKEKEPVEIMQIPNGI